MMDGIPGFPPGTQWEVKDVAPIRAKDGGFLMYTETTTGGNSGSPLFKYDEKENKALVVGVHVAGHEIANIAVPIMFHLSPQEKFQESESAMPRDSEISRGKFRIFLSKTMTEFREIL